MFWAWIDALMSQAISAPKESREGHFFLEAPPLFCNVNTPLLLTQGILTISSYLSACSASLARYTHSSLSTGPSIFFLIDRPGTPKTRRQFTSVYQISQIVGRLQNFNVPRGTCPILWTHLSDQLQVPFSLLSHKAGTLVNDLDKPMPHVCTHNYTMSIEKRYLI